MIHLQTRIDANRLLVAVPFRERVLGHGGPVRRRRLSTLQVNMGKVCNLACHHCHVDAGPHRMETIDGSIVDRVIDLLQALPISLLDITGGAPELSPHFRRLVRAARQAGRAVMDRCNLTVLFEPGQERLAEFLAAQRVEITASLPCYETGHVDRQRGHGVFDRSIDALKRLNALGYGTDLPLNLVYNPVDAALPPPQAGLEEEYRRQLHEAHGLVFTRLFVLTNMPIARFRHALDRDGQTSGYMARLENAFNPETLPGLMCRDLISIGWDGSVYDCDFNQMLGVPLEHSGRPLTVWDLHTDDTEGWLVSTGNHCYGCTAGCGSSCGGALL